jgi:hypothetical protein
MIRARGKKGPETECRQAIGTGDQTGLEVGQSSSTQSSGQYHGHQGLKPQEGDR